MSFMACGDVEEVLEELGGDVLVGRIRRAPVPARWPACSGSTCAIQRCRRPARDAARRAAARCGRRRRCCPARGSRPGRRCCPSASLRLTHQVKFSSSLWKMRSRKSRSAVPVMRLLDLVDAPGGPGVHGRIDVAEGPLVGRQLAVGMHVPLAQSAAAVDPWRTRGSISASGDAVKGQVPGGEPGILPLVGHRDDVGVVEMPPVAVAARLRARAAAAAGRVAVAASRVTS